jgi:hypothetical protein
MWYENKETGVKFDVTEEYAKQFFNDKPEMVKCDDPAKKKATKKKAEADGS